MWQSIIAGVFALAGVAVTLLVQGRQQRQRAQDERLWNRRADAYVAMLRYQGRGMVEGYRGAAPAEDWNVRDELAAKAAAFASQKVWDLWQQSAESNRELQEYVDEAWTQWHGVAGGPHALELEEEMEADPDFRHARQARADAARRLASQIRVELDVHRTGGLQRRWHPWPIRGTPLGGDRAVQRPEPRPSALRVGDPDTAAGRPAHTAEQKDVPSG
jgi:hypothetical protein